MNESEVLAVASDIRKLLMLAFKMMGRDMEQRLAQQNMPISGLQFGVIKLLEHHDGSALNEISRIMLHAPATLVPVVDALEKNGFVTRTRDIQDRRRTLVALTDKGWLALAEVHKVHHSEALVSSVRELGAEKCAHLVDLLYQLGGCIARHSGAEEFLAAAEQHSPLKTIPRRSDLPAETETGAETDSDQKRI